MFRGKVEDKSRNEVRMTLHELRNYIREVVEELERERREEDARLWQLRNGPPPREMRQ